MNIGRWETTVIGSFCSLTEFLDDLGVRRQITGGSAYSGKVCFYKMTCSGSWFKRTDRCCVFKGNALIVY